MIQTLSPRTQHINKPQAFFILLLFFKALKNSMHLDCTPHPQRKQHNTQILLQIDSYAEKHQELSNTKTITSMSTVFIVKIANKNNYSSSITMKLGENPLTSTQWQRNSIHVAVY